MKKLSELTLSEHTKLKESGMFWEIYPEATGDWYVDTQNNATVDQPTPKGSGPDIAKLVQQDIDARAQKGLETYGERLKANNGRNAKVDLYQELLDACMYIRQELEEDGYR